MQFRSTLEASWAVNLDALNIAWSYEPIALELPGGDRYLPDFWLPTIRTWLEVKGPGVPGMEKADTLAVAAAGDGAEWWTPQNIVVLGYPSINGRLTFDVVGAGEYGVLAACRECEGLWWMDYTLSFECRRCHTHDGDHHLAGTWRSQEIPWVQTQWTPRTAA